MPARGRAGEPAAAALHRARVSRDGRGAAAGRAGRQGRYVRFRRHLRSEEHTSELQSPDHFVCRLLLEKKKISLTLLPYFSFGHVIRNLPDIKSFVVAD